MLSIRHASRPIAWVGRSFDDLCCFPAEVRKEAGYQLHRLQAGLEAADWKPMTDIGPGVEEVRLRHVCGIYRIIYFARMEDAVYVLHCFGKKTQRTSEQDKHIAKARYQAVQQELRNRK